MEPDNREATKINFEMLQPSIHDQLGNHVSRRRFYPPEMVAFE